MKSKNGKKSFVPCRESKKAWSKPNHREKMASRMLCYFFVLLMSGAALVLVVKRQAKK